MYAPLGNSNSPEAVASEVSAAQCAPTSTAVESDDAATQQRVVQLEAQLADANQRLDALRARVERHEQHIRMAEDFAQHMMSCISEADSTFASFETEAVRQLLEHLNVDTTYEAEFAVQVSGTITVQFDHFSGIRPEDVSEYEFDVEVSSGDYNEVSNSLSIDRLEHLG